MVQIENSRTQIFRQDGTGDKDSWSLGQQLSDPGGPLQWPGSEAGFPVRGAQSPHLKQNEQHTVSHSFDYRSFMFKLWEKDDKDAYEYIMCRIVNGLFSKQDSKHIWNAKHEHYAVWLEWIQIYGIADATPQTGAPSDDSITTPARAGPPPNIPQGGSFEI